MTKRIPPHERRQFGRRRSHLRGTIHLNGRKHALCFVKNFSEAGASIMLDDDLPMPDTFLLTIERTGLRMRCEVKHRNGATYGVQFREEARRKEAATHGQGMLLTYGQLLSLAEADREQAEFDDRYGHALKAGPRVPDGVRGLSSRL